MKILKLLVVAGVSYLAYHFFSNHSNALAKSVENEPGHASLSGPGMGKSETTADESGASARHIVGRGVIRS